MLPENITSLLVTGNEVENLLFECAIHFAEVGLNVWFISPMPFNHLPENLKDVDREILKLITFLYFNDQKDLLTHLSGIHTWQKPPLLIILNGYEHYCGLFEQLFNIQKAALITASLIDATSACGKKMSSKASLLVACAVTNSLKLKKLQILVDLYFSNVVSYQGDTKLALNKIKSIFK